MGDRLRQMTVSCLISTYQELGRGEGRRTTRLVRVEGGSFTEVGIDEIRGVPGVYEIHDLEEDLSDHVVIARADSSKGKSPELSKDEAFSRSLRQLDDRGAMMHAQLQQDLKWYHERFLADQAKLDAKGVECAAKDEQIAQLLLQVNDTGDELIGLLKEGILIVKDYTFMGELKKRLNRCKLPKAKADQVHEIISSEEFKHAELGSSGAGGGLIAAALGAGGSS